MLKKRKTKEFRGKIFNRKTNPTFTAFATDSVEIVTEGFRSTNDATKIFSLFFHFRFFGIDVVLQEKNNEYVIQISILIQEPS